MANIFIVTVKNPLEKISIEEITRPCHLSRKSFYYHFQDKYDLLCWIHHNEFVGSLGDRGPSLFYPGTTRDGLSFHSE
ncbi:MAG: TetR family transcriptional regulator [Firmicutes bacterium]|nr:TetR family transcriptional regulator [Bacillota bacterium]